MKINFQSSNQTRDLGKIISLQRNISKGIKRKQSVSQLEQKLKSLVERSESITQQIDAAIPAVAIDQNLPIAEKSELIKQLLKDHQVLIVAGETGCGKTTQLPKICLQAGLGRRGKIAHTQPRRVAATSVANRIADELSCPLGGLVGYSVRFSDKLSQNTRVKLMTDGILLAELQSDPLLSQYEVVIIDEAHERSLNIDFLLGFLRQLLIKRKELRVIVTSATIDPDSFSKYFNNAPMVLVEGRTFPVTVNYRPIEEEQSDASNDDAILFSVGEAVDQCVTHSTGDILIFSYGENEIKSIDKYLRKRNLKNTKICPFFARLGIKEQQAIFKPSSQRKIIIATNVAETSLTIPNIVFVIDIGMARISRYSQRNKIQQLPVEKISQASAEQRKGRCGRIAPGICFRLYSEDDFNNRPIYTEAEISRTNLSSVVLRLKLLKVKDVEAFPFIQLPDKRQWKVAFNLLFELAAMDSEQQLTDIGIRMSKLAIDPQLSRLLLEPKLVAVNEMLIIASFLSVRDVRLRPLEHQQKADQLHAQYQDKNSDVTTVLNLWRYLEENRAELSSSKFKLWCQKNFINFVGLLEWRNVYFQIKESLSEHNIKINQQVAEQDEVHRSLICGFVGHLLQKTPEHYYQGPRGLKVWIHPSSVVFKKKADWLLSTELVETDKVYARGLVPINVNWIEQSVPHLVKNHYRDLHWRKAKGHAAYFQNQTVLGLPITVNRLVDSSFIEPELSRQLFLLEGLAKDNIAQNFPFLIENRTRLDEIKLEQEKLRKTDLKVSDEELARLYAQLIPDTLLTVNHLRKWLKKDWKARNQQLVFSKQQLLQRESETLEAYPSEVFVKGVYLPVSYSFSPGTDEDGMTVEIPPEMLKQFAQEDFEWLVPGYLSDKIQAVIKCLPKPIRKQLIPVADTSQACYEEIIRTNYQQQSFKSVLINTIKKIKGVNISNEIIDLEGIPSHLRMKFRTRLTKSKQNLMTDKLSEAIEKAALEPQNTVQESKGHSTDKKLYLWPNNFKGLEHTQQKQHQAIRFFSGLQDHQSYVSVIDYPDLLEAEHGHAQGVARLLIISQLKVVKEIYNGWPERKELEKLNLRFGGFSELLDWICLTVALSAVNRLKMPIEDNDSFGELQHQFINTMRTRIAHSLSQVLLLLKVINRIYLKLSSLNSKVYKTSVEDIKNQLASLWTAERVIQQADHLVENYSRYFQAIESRITKIDENFPREQQSLDNWMEWQDWWSDLCDESGDYKFKQAMHELFWMLQEYRISLFATKVKAVGGISAKKLQKKFEQLESWLI